LKILLVEDSQRLQRSISTGLRVVGHAVDQAFDGQ
jgi:DNA-binding response OmpR family regulator